MIMLCVFLLYYCEVILRCEYLFYIMLCYIMQHYIALYYNIIFFHAFYYGNIIF